MSPKTCFPDIHTCTWSDMHVCMCVYTYITIHIMHIIHIMIHITIHITTQVCHTCIHMHTYMHTYIHIILRGCGGNQPLFTYIHTYMHILEWFLANTHWKCREKHELEGFAHVCHVSRHSRLALWRYIWTASRPPWAPLPPCSSLYICMRVCVCVCVCVCTYKYVCMCTYYLYKCMYACVCIKIQLCTSCMYPYTCMYVCACTTNTHQRHTCMHA